jgi:hypothetical protein
LIYKFNNLLKLHNILKNPKWYSYSINGILRNLNIMSHNNNNEYCRQDYIKMKIILIYFGITMSNIWVRNQEELIMKLIN